jgi:hypothetical protein
MLRFLPNLLAPVRADAPSCVLIRVASHVLYASSGLRHCDMHRNDGRTVDCSRLCSFHICVSWLSVPERRMKPASAEAHRQSRRHSLRKEPGASRSGQCTRDEPAEPSGAHQKTIRVDHPFGTAAINRSRIHRRCNGSRFCAHLGCRRSPGHRHSAQTRRKSGNFRICWYFCWYYCADLRDRCHLDGCRLHHDGKRLIFAESCARTTNASVNRRSRRRNHPQEVSGRSFRGRLVSWF